MKITKTYDALPTAFDRKEGGKGGPLAFFSIDGNICRVPVYCTDQELTDFMSIGRCKLTITIEKETT